MVFPLLIGGALLAGKILGKKGKKKVKGHAKKTIKSKLRKKN